MVRFDYLRFEPLETLDRPPAEHRAFVSGDLMARYSSVEGKGVVGLPIWEAVVGDVLGLLDHGAIDIARRQREISEQFFERINQEFPRPAKSCVFISHQRADAHRGERVACLTDHHGIDYWLDVCDPTLRRVNNSSLCGPLRSLLIAATIEIALLNSSHVIALHTAHSTMSRWVPYEFARAKARGLTSLQAAGWFESGQSPATCGDYVQLAVMTHDEAQISSWLRRVPGSVSPKARVPAFCKPHQARAL
jgi:hypothetical protein